MVQAQATRPKNSAEAMNKPQNTMEYIKCKFSLYGLLNKSLRFSLFSCGNLTILFLMQNLF